MELFSESKWIWLSSGEICDSYAEFKDNIVYESGDVTLRISCDTDYTLCINGEYVASGQYGDYEHYKIYDEIDVTDFLKQGENKVDILVYYCGVSTSRYCSANAGLIYEFVCGESVLAHSYEGVYSRISPNYSHGLKKLITNQLGFSFEYDASKNDESGYLNSVVVEKPMRLFPRPVSKSSVLERCPIKKLIKFSDTHYLVDLGTETVGLPTFELVSNTQQKVTVAWGEHIIDGGVRQLVGGRDFSFDYHTVCGENRYTNYMLRLGCRYIEVFSQNPIELNYIGILPQVYKVQSLPYFIESVTERRIYEICLNTLKLCMMEHYVDCPWREQAMYAFDSRNQMLCGYYCFEDGNAEYARANLKLIAEDKRSDGLLSICYPSGSPRAIPSFSLYWIIAMREYIDHTSDISLANEYFDKLTCVLDEFIKNSHVGLVYNFTREYMWNFYDWSEFSAGSLHHVESPCPDLILNSLCILAMDSFEKICSYTGKAFPYAGVSNQIRQCSYEQFYTEKGMFTMRRDTDAFTELCNSLALLAGVVKGDEAKKLCDVLVSSTLVKCSLSMKIMMYEALMSVDKEKYKEFILNDIRSNYVPMLDAGSDTVWETAVGASDFKNAGSLCHGWSAVPIYIYKKLGIV